MVNILSAIVALHRIKENNLDSYETKSRIRINSIGEKLEFFIKDAICDSFYLDLQLKNHLYGQWLSYQGSQNNPPDLIIHNGDAFEIKKIQTTKPKLALSNSHPKDKLYVNDPKITEECRTIVSRENHPKDLYYVVGQVKSSEVKYLFFVHGSCYAASPSAYQTLHDAIREGINQFTEHEGLIVTQNKELGRIKGVDPLQATEYRMRGMWELHHPFVVFDYLYQYDPTQEFALIALLTEEKYDSYPTDDRQNLQSNNDINIRSVQVKDPNNPQDYMAAKLISYTW